MTDGRIIFEIFLAAFAVIGFYCILKLVAELLFPSDCLDVAVRIYDEEQVERLDIILNIAASKGYRHRGEGIVVLISSRLMQGTMGYGEVLRPELEALLRHYNADCFVVNLDREED